VERLGLMPKSKRLKAQLKVQLDQQKQRETEGKAEKAGEAMAAALIGGSGGCGPGGGKAAREKARAEREEKERASLLAEAVADMEDGMDDPVAASAAAAAAEAALGAAASASAAAASAAVDSESKNGNGLAAGVGAAGGPGGAGGAGGGADLLLPGAERKWLHVSLCDALADMKDYFLMVHLQYQCDKCGEFIVNGVVHASEAQGVDLCAACYAEERAGPNGGSMADDFKAIEVVLRELASASADPDAPTPDAEKGSFTSAGKLFLKLCEFRHQFDTLRRAKFTTMLMLQYLHAIVEPRVTAYPCDEDDGPVGEPTPFGGSYGAHGDGQKFVLSLYHRGRERFPWKHEKMAEAAEAEDGAGAELALGGAGDTEDHDRPPVGGLMAGGAMARAGGMADAGAAGQLGTGGAAANEACNEVDHPDVGRTINLLWPEDNMMYP
jgi:hypothetical protein